MIHWLIILSNALFPKFIPFDFLKRINLYSCANPNSFIYSKVKQLKKKDTLSITPKRMMN